MTPDQLRTLGEAIYGPRWQSDMARDLDVSDRTVRRWVAGEPIPAGVGDELRAIARTRAAQLAAVAGQP